MTAPDTQPANASWSPSGEDAGTSISEELHDEAPQDRQSGRAVAGSSQDNPVRHSERGDPASSRNIAEHDVEAYGASLDDLNRLGLSGNAEPRSWFQIKAKKIQSALIKTFQNTREDDDAYGAFDITDMGRWLIYHHDNSLMQRIRKPVNFSKMIYRVSFVEMQRMHLRKLQIKLVKHAVDMYHTRNETETWETDLAAYIKAMKDYGYIAQCSKQRRDYFLATGERDVDRFITDCIIRQTVGDPENLTLQENRDSIIEPSQPWDEGRPIGDTRDKTSFHDLMDRLFMGAVGAFMLLGPMWIMVLVKKPFTSLITTTVCVGAFGLVAVFRLERPIDVLSVTAAYAAVLVVFVGLST